MKYLISKLTDEKCGKLEKIELLLNFSKVVAKDLKTHCFVAKVNVCEKRRELVTYINNECDKDL